MRQIIFRGKLSHSKTQWVEGNLIIARDGQPYIIPTEIFEPDGHHLIIDSDNPFWVDSDTVGQFTHVFDNNGSKIFEGHKIRTKHGTVYNVKDMIEFHSWLDRQFVTNPEKYIEIIGNAE